MPLPPSKIKIFKIYRELTSGGLLLFSSDFSCILNNLLPSQSRRIQQNMTSRKKDCMWEFGINWNFLLRKGRENMYFSSLPTALRA